MNSQGEDLRTSDESVKCERDRQKQGPRILHQLRNVELIVKSRNMSERARYREYKESVVDILQVVETRKRR